MHVGDFFLQALLSLVFIWAFAHGSPVVDDDTDISESFNDHFDVDLRDDGLPLRRVHHRYLYKRDLHHELFEPRSELQLDVLLGDYMMSDSMRVLLIIRRPQRADIQLCSQQCIIRQFRVTSSSRLATP
jgi:hypothetical protein